MQTPVMPPIDKEARCDLQHSRTALHMAVLGGHVEAVEALLQASAYAAVPDADGDIPLTVARRMLPQPAVGSGHHLTLFLPQNPPLLSIH